MTSNYCKEEKIMANGKNFLKVCGIIMIVGGGISLIMSLVAAFGIAVLITLGQTAVAIGGIIAVLGGILELVCGILGVVNCNKPEKANLCLAFGVVVLVCQVVANILYIVGDSFSFFSFVLGLVLPILFVIGAVLNKKSVQA